MAEVTETRLPGVGVRHEFTTVAGERVAVLSHRTGRREVAVYDRIGPDASHTVLHLSGDDSRTLTEARYADQLTRLVVRPAPTSG